MDIRLYKTAFFLILIPAIACLISMIMRIMFGDVSDFGDSIGDTLLRLIIVITGIIIVLGYMSVALGLILAIIAKIRYKVRVKAALIIGFAFFLVITPYGWILLLSLQYNKY